MAICIFIVCSLSPLIQLGFGNLHNYQIIPYLDLGLIILRIPLKKSEYYLRHVELSNDPLITNEWQGHGHTTLEYKNH